MHKVVFDRHDDIVNLCHKFKVESLDVIKADVSAQMGPGDNPVDFYVTFQEMDFDDHVDAYLALMVELADLFPDRYVFLGLDSTPGEPYFKRKEIRESVYAV